MILKSVASLTNNFVHHNQNNGIELQNASKITPSLFKNNVVFANSNNGLTLAPFAITAHSNLIVENGQAKQPARAWGIHHSGTTSKHTTLIENIFDRNGFRIARGGDIYNPQKILTTSSRDNYTTTGKEPGAKCCTNANIFIIARLLNDFGYPTPTITRILRDVYDISTVADSFSILRATGFSSREIARSLKEVFGVAAVDFAHLLFAEGEMDTDVAQVLKDEFNSSAGDVAGIFTSLGRSPNDFIPILVDIYGTSAETVAGILYQLEFSLTDIANILERHFSSSPQAIAGYFLALGVDADIVSSLFPSAIAKQGDEVYVPGLCGDAWCDFPTERYETCPADCLQSCYGHPELCNRLFRDILIAGTHNSNVSYAYLNALPNQTYTITRQLNDGIRHLDLDIDYCRAGENSGTICLCHGNDSCETLGGITAGRGLREIRDWLMENPSEVVVLNFESYLEGEDLPQVLIDNGFAQMAYHLPQGVCSLTGIACRHNDNCPGDDNKCERSQELNWPYTWNNMVMRNQRVVIFQTGGGTYRGESFGDWILNRFTKTDYGVSLFEDWADKCNSPQADERYGLEHVRGTGIGDPLAATCDNSTRNILNHIEDCRDTNKNPIFFIVDFYETNAGAFEAPNQYNGVSHIPVLTSSEGKCNCHRSDDCIATQFCFATFCADRLPTGAGPCFSDDYCLSEKCAGLCVECRTHGDCPGDEACVLGACAPKADNGVPCVENAQCKSDKCRGICQECDSNADCSSDEYCSVGECRAKAGNGSPCLQDAVCQSGHCAAVCVECTSDSHCGSDQYCGASGCQSKKSNGGVCLKDSVCESDVCCVGFCANSCL